MKSYSYNKDNVISWLKNNHWHCCNKKKECKHQLTHAHDTCSCGMTFFIYKWVDAAKLIIVYYKIGKLIYLGTNGKRVIIGKPEKIFPIDKRGNIDFSSELPLVEQFLVKNIIFRKISKVLFNLEKPLEVFLKQLEEEKKKKEEKEKRRKTAQAV